MKNRLLLKKLKSVVVGENIVKTLAEFKDGGEVVFKCIAAATPEGNLYSLRIEVDDIPHGGGPAKLDFCPAENIP